MNRILEFIILHARTVLLLFVFLLVSGAVSYINMPKEAEPDITIPIIYVSMSLEGISPEDGERLLIRPMEKELRGIEGVKEMTAAAAEGYASVTLEFEAGYNIEKALSDVRDKVDIANAELPEEADEPLVNEVSFAQFPVLVVGLSGKVPRRTLLKLARDLKDSIETLPQILDIDIGGDQEDLLEVIIDPELFEGYGFTFQEIISLITQNNKLVAAGTFDVGNGRFPIKVPGLFEEPDDVFDIPVKVIDDRVITLRDVATVRKSFVDPKGFARIGGKPAITLEIKKRTGENLIETVDAVREMVAQESQEWPEAIEISFFQDKSDEIKMMLTDLQNNLISAIALVMIVIVIALGLRTAGLVGIAIPGSMLLGLFVLNLLGLTINIVVLFSLILAVGMLVDGAIIVTEYADRKMAEGIHRSRAYIQGSQRMAWPIIASTATTLAAFMPLLLWPGMVGEFMKFLPITLIATLSASLLMALVFVPTIGSLMGQTSSVTDSAIKHLAAAESGSLEDLKGAVGWYVRLLRRWLQHPGVNFLIACLIFLGSYGLYIFFGKGVEFFPNIEPERVSVYMRARGNLSIYELDELLKQIEGRILDMPELKTIYARSGTDMEEQETTEDTHGIIQIEFTDWRKRRKGSIILAEATQRLSDLPGVIIELRQEEGGPGVGKPISIELTSRFPELLGPAIEKFNQKFQSMAGLKDIDDSRPVPGIEWRVEVDRAQASRFGANIQLAGDIIQFVTTGLKISDYRPDDSDDEVDIRVRYPVQNRNLTQLDDLKIQTAAGLVPLGNFVKEYPDFKQGNISRSGGHRMLNIRTDVEEGVLVDDKVKEIQKWVAKEANLDPRIDIAFKGEDEEQEESRVFLAKAFMAALGVMLIILVTQFNSFYDALLILTAVIFSTVGVFVGLLLTGQPFGIVMNGIGVISLAGIVVNNNIVLIDTYRRILSQGLPVMDAVLRTCAQRLRPVFLTTVTTILGLIPMVLALNIDFVEREITYGAPSTQWWKQLATSVAFGLAFATLLTLVLTPSLLVLQDHVSTWFKKMFRIQK